jgi:hypothetical protein
MIIFGNQFFYMLKIKETLILLVLSFPLMLKAQTDSLQLIPKSRHQAWIKVATVGAGIGAGVLLDQPVHSFTIHHQTSFFNQVSHISDALGEKTIVVPALLTTFAGSYLLKDEKLKTTAWNAIKSVLVTSVFTEGVKISAGRERPFVSGNNLSFNSFDGQDVYKSFPSGHSSFAFAVFTPFAETYSRWLYLVPASVALGRVYQQKHWLTDVMVGGAIGWASGYLFTHSKKKVVVGPGGLVIWF